jgi:hypothetical protein
MVYVCSALVVAVAFRDQHDLSSPHHRASHSFGLSFFNSATLFTTIQSFIRIRLYEQTQTCSAGYLIEHSSELFVNRVPKSRAPSRSDAPNPPDLSLNLAPSLLTMSIEIIDLISSNLEPGELPSVRLVCRLLNEKTSNIFGQQYLREVRIAWSWDGLQHRKNISKIETLRAYIQQLSITDDLAHN